MQLQQQWWCCRCGKSSSADVGGGYCDGAGVVTLDCAAGKGPAEEV